jgi:methionine-S-sulfoxide reductase
VIRTRVGYAGGTTPDPTYHNIGDHSETLQLDYDPAQISYEELLRGFWQTHNPCVGSGIRQYRAAIFYHNDEQKRLALRTRDEEALRQHAAIVTEILPATTFYLAEDYHQKYMLRQDAALMREFRAMYPDERSLRDSTAAARVNGYLGGHGSRALLEKEIGSWGLSSAAQAELRELCSLGR